MRGAGGDHREAVFLLIDADIGDDGAGLQLAEVGVQVAQSERGMAVLGVERGEDDVRHRLETSN
jgi:hypothetical protein